MDKNKDPERLYKSETHSKGIGADTECLDFDDKLEELAHRKYPWI